MPEPISTCISSDQLLIEFTLYGLWYISTNMVDDSILQTFMSKQL